MLDAEELALGEEVERRVAAGDERFAAALEGLVGLGFDRDEAIGGLERCLLVANGDADRLDDALELLLADIEVLRQDAGAEVLFERLLVGGRSPSVAVLRGIGRLEPPPTERLLAIALSEDLSLEDSPGDAWAPIHAVRLLGERPTAAVVDPLLDRLEALDSLDILFSECISALRAMGELVVDPILARLSEAWEERSGPLVEILGGCGVRDPRVFSALTSGLSDETCLVAGCLAEYGDPAAIPQLRAAFDSFDPTDPMNRHELVELAGALETLRGHLEPDEEEAVDTVRMARAQMLAKMAAEAHRAAQPPPPPPRRTKSTKEKAKQKRKRKLARANRKKK